MITRHLRFAILFLALLSSVVAFSQTSFKVVPPGNVIAGRNFSLTFRLTNGQTNAPKPPELQGCDLLYGPSVSTMSSSQYINGQMSSTTSVDYTYMYRATTPGKVTVPEITVNSGGKDYTSKSVSFEILPPDKQVQSQQGGQQSAPPVSAVDPSTHRPGAVSPNDLFVRVSFSKTHALEQEAVMATIKVYTKYSITSFLVTQQPLFDGFLSEELPVNLEVNLENYNGQNYNTAVLKRLLLYPQKSGKLTVNSGKYDITIQQFELVNMGFFTTQRPVERQITTESNMASIEVTPLPEPKPAGFEGAVGSFTVSTDLQPELLRTNEAALYTYTIKGTGNIRYLKQPDVKFPASIDRYTPKTDIDARIVGANTTGTYRVDYTIVPQEAGKLVIPGTPFVYYDIDKKEYVTLDTRSYELNVAKGSSTSSVVEQREIDKSMHDILHIKPSTELSKKEISYIFHNGLYWLAFIIAIAILIAVAVIYRRQLKFNADVKGRKIARANRVVSKRLKSAREFMKAHENEKFYAELAKAMWGYISDKLSIAPSQLIRDNIASQLENYGASDQTVKDVLSVLDECEMARFTPQHSDQEVAQLYDQAVAAIKSLEDVKK
ncbi:MAG: BatD family protein [Muribaculaceae bacterium]|nr:BatD family protein [Muribaculaceae bacterium]